MYTVKFVKFHEGATSTASFSVPHYQVHERSNGVKSVTVYTALHDVGGIERHVSPHENDFDVCYVENEQGKTLERIMGRAS